MTVANEILKVTANGNGSSTVFSFSPIVLPNDEDDLVVTKVSTAGVETTLTRGVGATNYSVTLTGAVPSTGSITYPATGATRLETGEKLIMRRVLDLLQPTDLENLGGYFPDTQEGVFDRLTMLIQQLQEQIDRSLKIPVAETGAAANTTIPTVEDGAGYLYRNASDAYEISSGVADSPVSAAMAPVVNAATTAAALTELGVSAFVQTTFNDPDAATFRATIGVTEVSSASESAEGIAELATDAEALAGTDTARIVPTAKIGGWIGRALEPGGRLTLTTATPVTVTDVTAAGTVYYAPHKHNLAPIWNATRWQVYSFSELSLVLEAAQQLSGANHDLFLFDLAGALTLGTGPAWTNATTRADALGRKDGRWTNNGSITIRTNGANNTVAANKALYVGTIRMTANAQTEDSKAKRFLWNMYNRAPRQMRAATETTDTWDYATATWRQANANAANQLMFLRGLDEDIVTAEAFGICGNSQSDSTLTGIGLDATNAIAADSYPGVNQGATAEQEYGMTAKYRGLPGIGYHYLAWLEYSEAGATSSSWKGDSGAPTVYQSGIHGELFA